MILLKLRDNALFVRNFRERMRPHVIGSYAAILFVLVMIFFLTLTETFAKTGRENAFFPFISHCIPAWVLVIIAVFQGFVVLVLGTLSAYRMALQDRLNGTIDFFRATPTKGLNHVIGLVFGAPVMEWLFFLLLVPVMLVLALMSDAKIAALVEFYISVIICAVFYHSLGVLAGVCATLKKYRATINILFLAALICVGTVVLIATNSSVAYHSTFLPGYTNLLVAIMDSDAFSGSDFLKYNFYIFFGKPLHSLFFQALVQVPLCILVCLAIKRKISSAESPILSKSQLSLLALVILVFFTGDSQVTAGFRSISYIKEGFNPILFIYFYLFFFLSAFFGIITAPTALIYRKGLSRANKSGLPKPGWFDEQNSNTSWITVMCILFAIIHFVLCARFKVKPFFGITSFAVLAVFIVFFANAIEFFKLSRFHSRTIVFATLVLITWIALPLIEGILTQQRYPFFLCFSPLLMLAVWGGNITTIIPTSIKITHADIQRVTVEFTGSEYPESLDTSAFVMILGHIALLVVTILFIVLALNERKRIRASVAGSRDLHERNDRLAQPAQPVNSI